MSGAGGGQAAGVNRREVAALDAPALPGRPLLRVDEAAAILSISEESVRRMLDCGALTAVKVGAGAQRAHVRVATSSVRRLLEGE